MTISQDGHRTRYYAERKKVAAQQGKPLREDVTSATRRRIANELTRRSYFLDDFSEVVRFDDVAVGDMNRVLDRKGFNQISELSLDHHLEGLHIDDFLLAIEIWVDHAVRYRKPLELIGDLNLINSLLADDLTVFRVLDSGAGNLPRYRLDRVDNEHLYKTITDRTFELTRVADFAAAQGDYADAWRHYSKGDLDDAVANAGKAVESACKAVIKKVDPSATPEHMNLGPLVGELVRLQIIPAQLTHTCTHLEHIFRGSGTLRNQAGAAHGSLDPTSPEASTALLALRLSGTLIAFLAERWTQLRPKKQ